MKVLLLNAGAKDYGATQEILLTIKNAAVNISAKLICLGSCKIEYCKGCKACYQTYGCVQKDDMEMLKKELNAADRIVIAAPSYWADVPGQFKVFIDRCTAYSNTNPLFRPNGSGKRCYAIALRTGTRPMECEHIIETIRHWCGHMEIDLADSMYFCGIQDEQDIAPYRNMIVSKAKAWFAR